MSRCSKCGENAPCNCVLVDSNGNALVGDGSAGNPYVIPPGGGCSAELSPSNTQAENQAILNSLAGGGTACAPNGLYDVAVPYLVPNNVRIQGESEFATFFQATPGFAGDAMFRPTSIAGTQESMYLERLRVYGNRGAGAAVPAGVRLSGMYVNTSVRHCVIEECSGNGIYIDGIAPQINMGPILLDDLWVVRCGLDLILCDGSMRSIWGSNLTLEFPDAGAWAMRIRDTQDTTLSLNHHFQNIHLEQALSPLGILLESVDCISIDTVESTTAHQPLIRLTGTPTSLFGPRNINLRNLQPGSAANIAVDDVARGVQILGATAAYTSGHNVSRTLELLGELQTSGPVPTTTATPVGTYPAAGTGPVVDAVAGSDVAGAVNITTGTGTAPGDLLRVNFSATLDLIPRTVLLTPVLANAAAAGLYISSATTTGFTVACLNAPPASTAIPFSYMVVTHA